MCISKRFSNTGKTGNHGMQEIDLLRRKMIEDKLEEESNDIIIGCGNGCEFTLLGDKISVKEAVILGRYINKENLCPFCKTTNGSINFQYAVENQNHLREYCFTMDDIRYQTIYKPSGYKFLPPDESEE